MPHVIFTDQAKRDLVRLADFMREKDPATGKRVIKTILESTGKLAGFPAIGKPVKDYEALPYARELVIPFGSAGYNVLYDYTPDSDSVIVMAIRHNREAGYKPSEM